MRLNKTILDNLSVKASLLSPSCLPFFRMTCQQDSGSDSANGRQQKHLFASPVAADSVSVQFCSHLCRFFSEYCLRTRGSCDHCWCSPALPATSRLSESWRQLSLIFIFQPIQRVPILNIINLGGLLGGGEGVGMMLGHKSRLPVLNNSTSVPIWALPFSSPLHSFQGDSFQGAWNPHIDVTW